MHRSAASNHGYGSVDVCQLVDSLTDQSYGEPTKIVPWLAKSWEISMTYAQKRSAALGGAFLLIA
ncbi:hypothetical protein FJ942_11160 [Mesorhizobium sp. B2-4-2]|nr:hypothetical protein FJ867_02820 [Mesorhizobium sp. B2-5-3]TPL57608.1 hypothetical protein FJ942_11160 [Mesorhizobium sp. B2-4-2]